MNTQLSLLQQLYTLTTSSTPYIKDDLLKILHNIKPSEGAARETRKFASFLNGRYFFNCKNIFSIFEKDQKFFLKKKLIV